MTGAGFGGCGGDRERGFLFCGAAFLFIVGGVLKNMLHYDSLSRQRGKEQIAEFLINATCL